MDSGLSNSQVSQPQAVYANGRALRQLVAGCPVKSARTISMAVTIHGFINMGRGTSYHAISEAVAANERLTRAQGHSLLAYAQEQDECIEKQRTRILELERALEDARFAHERDKDMWTSLASKWNAMIHMLHTFLGCSLYDEGGDVAEQYRAALEEKWREARTI